ncbi:hypothetical protein Leryth_021082 [Lithospermum erythrorhizon]|uniref:Protein WUSCHEL n=1 Tax=Lithospermum erythrorhizon TaxID=34254 RepID=A0AAV3R6W3_LITER|nr:hypothetical protein Leryth_021082 [Lithospermum erythrorhizon]
MDEGLEGFRVKSRGGGNRGGGGTKCGRWNPTTEQVKVLTDLFRAGLRTPTTDQIQKISSQLSFYGNIESKNVFYWFQNHKARERQKRRRVLVEDDEFNDYREFQRDEKISSARHFSEINQEMMETERVTETLQLFPLNPYWETEHEKLRYYANEYNKENHASFPCNFEAEMDHTTLDLRLSFL